MKTITLILITILLSISMFAQVPGKINYQAIVRDTNGDLVRNQQVRMKISILLNSDSGSPLYTEIHDAESNENGLVSLEIGNGRTTDVFTAIDWSTGIYFLKTETDPEGNSNFTISGTSQILSVPYAFHAQTVENDMVDDADADATNEIQDLQLSGTQLTLSKGGGSVVLPSSGSGDNWGTQTVTSDATLLGKGTEADPLKVANSAIEPDWGKIINKPEGFADNTDDVNDADADPNNEIQTLSVSGNDLTISDGNTVALPAGVTSPWQVSDSGIYFNSGNVGIGTTDPQGKLEVTTLLPTAVFGQSGSGVGGLFYSGGTSGKGVIGVVFGTSGTNYGGVFASKSTSGTGVFGEAEAESGINYGGKFKTRSATGYSGYFEGGKFFVDGDVGIGTDNPKFKLDVHGGGIFMEESGGLFISPDENKVRIGYHSPSGYTTNAFFSWQKTQFVGDFTIMNGNTGIGTENPERLLHLSGSNPRILIEASSSNPEINFKSDGDADFDIWSIYKNSSSGDLQFFQNGNKLTLQKNTGYMGIGTSTPQGRLDVNGAIYQRGGVLHADYVFEEDYQLETIEEHAEFMWENKHLPAIPKATTDDNGNEIVEVGSHRKGIVEELEKAHIYISQLEKANQEQTLLIDILNTENKELSSKINNQESRLEQLEVLVKKSVSN